MNPQSDSTASLGAQMETTRIARYRKLDIIEAQKGHDMPLPVADLIWSRKIMAAIANEDKAVEAGGFKAPVRGAGGMTMAFAVCPPGTGPTLHRHHRTHETFTVLQGRFEFSVGPTGADKIALDRFDVFSVPPGVERGFRNISNEEGVLQVIITGGVHDRSDISFPRKTADEIRAAGDQYLEYFKRHGLKFDQ